MLLYASGVDSQCDEKPVEVLREGKTNKKGSG